MINMKYPPAQLIAPPGECRELLQCIFSLNPLEVEVYSILVQEGSLKADEVAKRINRDRSTAYRCLRHLISCNLCFKKRQFPEMGGHYYIYFAQAPKEVKECLDECVDSWHRRINDTIEEFINKFKVQQRE